jgi:hypothetical protein
MDNLARVVAVTVQGNQLQPCLRVNRGIYVASHDHGAKFKIELCFTYTSGGTQIGPINLTVPVSNTTFRHVLDTRNIRAQGPTVGIHSHPDRGTPIVCTARLIILDGSGAQVEVGNAATTSFKAP